MPSFYSTPYFTDFEDAFGDFTTQRVTTAANEMLAALAAPLVPNPGVVTSVDHICLSAIMLAQVAAVLLRTSGLNFQLPDARPFNESFIMCKLMAAFYIKGLDGVAIIASPTVSSHLGPIVATLLHDVPQSTVRAAFDLAEAVIASSYAKPDFGWTY